MTTRKKKIELKEVGIFALACERGHNFQPLRRSETGEIDGYYKHNNGEAEKDKLFCMLFCNQCGSTKEIVMINRRRD